jgi:hypothetical protein
LFGKPYEVCKSCETLKEQLDYERSNNKQLQETLIQILKPTMQEAVPVEVNPVINTGTLFSRRRSMLEAQERHAAQVAASSKNLGKSNDPIEAAKVEKLERELGIAEG